ncbi:MAG TPA: histidine kinase [Saprospiraceae bacterium]|nr:histidine kinase [Saprospiraceae bacterium]HPN70152.1 histidine kinase [Saprospiraceae bacterium]
MTSTAIEAKMDKTLKGIIQVFLACLIINFFTRGMEVASLKDVYFLMVSTVTSMMIWYGCAFVAEAYKDEIPWTEKPYLRLVLSVTATAIWVLFVYLLTNFLWLLGYPNFSIGKVFRNLNFHDYIFTFLITIMISSFLYGRGFFLEWKAKFQEAEKHKEEKLLYQYEMLRNQVNPHFLFNNLSVLSNLVHKDADLAESFIGKFANVYRYVLDSRMKELVSIREELNHLEDYLFLMKIRFGDGFNFENNVNDENGMILPMTLQMLIENVFKHNNVSKLEPLTIHLTLQDNYLVVQNKMYKRHNVEVSGIGLENIKERYRHLTNQPIIVENDGEFFTVKIPIIS